MKVFDPVLNEGHENSMGIRFPVQSFPAALLSEDLMWFPGGKDGGWLAGQYLAVIPYCTIQMYSGSFFWIIHFHLIEKHRLQGQLKSMYQLEKRGFPSYKFLLIGH